MSYGFIIDNRNCIGCKTCMQACPAHAIISGDLDDRQSEMSRLLAANPVQVSKPSDIEGERLIENGYL